LCWELTRKQFDNLLSQPCYYCGASPRRVIVKKAFGFLVCNGIDRRDNGTGYTVANAVSCCPRCNRSKGPMSEDEFWEWIQNVYKHTSQKVQHVF
jgi:hypothetical protein